MESGYHVRIAFEFCPRSGGAEAIGRLDLPQVRRKPEDGAQVAQEVPGERPGRSGRPLATSAFAGAHRGVREGEGVADPRHLWLGRSEDLGLLAQPSGGAKRAAAAAERANRRHDFGAAWPRDPGADAGLDGAAIFRAFGTARVVAVRFQGGARSGASARLSVHGTGRSLALSAGAAGLRRRADEDGLGGLVDDLRGVRFAPAIAV